MNERSGPFWDAVEGRARPGRVVGRGRVVHRDGDMAFLEASLLDSHSTVIATATARVITLDQARSAA